jgi:hypothetical protein
MSIQKYISDTKDIPYSNDLVYNYLSNFENLASYINSGLLDKISEQVPQIKISDFYSDRDCCRFSIIGLGSAEIRIVNRDPIKTIKVESSGGMPMSITLWIQLLPDGTKASKMRLTLQTEMSMLIKMMVGNKLEEGINHFADILARLPYKDDAPLA